MCENEYLRDTFCLGTLKEDTIVCDTIRASAPESGNDS